MDTRHLSPTETEPVETVMVPEIETVETVMVPEIETVETVMVPETPRAGNSDGNSFPAQELNTESTPEPNTPVPEDPDTKLTSNPITVQVINNRDPEVASDVTSEASHGVTTVAEDDEESNREKDSSDPDIDSPVKSANDLDDDEDNESNGGDQKTELVVTSKSNESVTESGDDPDVQASELTQTQSKSKRSSFDFYLTHGFLAAGFGALVLIGGILLKRSIG